MIMIRLNYRWLTPEVLHLMKYGVGHFKHTHPCPHRRFFFLLVYIVHDSSLTWLIFKRREMQDLPVRDHIIT